MPSTSNRTSAGTIVHRAPGEASSPFGASAHRSRPFGAIAGDNGQTDFYLLRSYAIVERLRRAVADRDDLTEFYAVQ